MTPAEKTILQNQAAIMGALAQLLAELCAAPSTKRGLNLLEERVKATGDFVLTSELISVQTGTGKTGS